MAFDIVLQTVIPVFAIILLGYIIGKFRKIEIRPITDLVVYIAAPCLIFSSVSRSDINISDFGIIAIATVCIILIQALLVFIAMKIAKSKKKGLYLPMTFSNTAFLGYPVALFAFEEAGLSMAVVYDAVTALILYSLGIYIIHHKNDLKEAFKVPLVYAVILGLIFNLFKISVPIAVMKPIEMVGMITIPLALLILGYKLTEIKIQSTKIAFGASVYKIFGGLLIALLVVKVLSITGLTKNVILLQATMPSALMTMILCQKYHRDEAVVASVVLITTVLSLFTIPLILGFI